MTFKITLTDSEGILLDSWEIANNNTENGYNLTTTFGASGLINEINREISIAEGSK